MLKALIPAALPKNRPPRRYLTVFRVGVLFLCLMIALLALRGSRLVRADVRVKPHGGYSEQTDFCQICHQVHNPTYRALASASVDDVCATCHDPLKVQTHTDNTCSTCHEPHARTTNLRLIRNVVKDRRVVFVNLSGRDSFDDGTSDAALCRVCHTQTQVHNNVRASPYHYNGDRCTRCHPHADGFEPNPTCDACHGQPPGSGAHQAHFNANYGPKVGGCDACHWRVTDWRSHRTGKVEFRDGRGLSDTNACDNCHGTAEGVQAAKQKWASDSRIDNCLYCHNSSDPATSQYDGGGVKAPAQSAFYTSGHGKNQPYAVSGNPGADLSCTRCHDQNARHITGTPGDERRLSEDSPGLCFRCHGGSDPGKVVSQHGNDFAGRRYSPFAINCTECHNVHGTGNIFMIAGNIRGNEIQFIAKTGAGSFDPPGGDKKTHLCTTCHTQTTHNNRSNTGPAHNEGAECTRCHTHSLDNNPTTRDGFMPACNACHGQPPPPGAPGYTRFDDQLTPHRKHAGSGTDQLGYACFTCHDQSNQNYTGHITEPPSYQDIFFDGTRPELANGMYDRATYTCDNLYCHSNGKPMNNPVVYARPQWGENKTLGCNGCHGDATTLVTNAHVGHLAAQYRDRGANAIGCATCHQATAASNTTLISREQHVNGLKDVVINAKPVVGRTGQPTYTAETRTCANVVCHSDGAASREQPGQPTYTSPAWDKPESGACGTCHGVVTETLKSGRHPTHLGFGLECQACHTAPDAGTHVDGQVEFRDGKLLSQTDACNACHSPDGPFDGVAEARSRWYGTERLSCQGCHDGGVSQVKGVNAPNVMGDNRTYGFNVTGHGRPGAENACTACHDPSQPHIDGVTHSYSASAGNYASAFRLKPGLQLPISLVSGYNRANFDLCFQCHAEAGVIGMPENYSNGLFTHTKPPLIAPIKTHFRNESPEGFNFNNVPANIHWDHLDMSNTGWDSDGNGTKESAPSCLTCHDPHGVKSHRGDTNYPAMTLATIGIYQAESPIGNFGQITRSEYQRYCNVCHGGIGQRYYWRSILGATSLIAPTVPARLESRPDRTWNREHLPPAPTPVENEPPVLVPSLPTPSPSGVTPSPPQATPAPPSPTTPPVNPPSTAVPPTASAPPPGTTPVPPTASALPPSTPPAPTPTPGSTAVAEPTPPSAQ